MSGEPDDTHVVTEVLATELCPDPEAPGERKDLGFHLEVTERMCIHAPVHRERVEVAGTRVLGDLESLLRARPAHNDREMVGGTCGRAQ